MKYISLLSYAILSVASCHAFGVNQQGPSSPSVPEMTRSNFLAVVGGLTASTCVAPSAWAKEDASLKGTKKEPAFEACLSQCMYDCTKPKGNEQKSRKECLPECKQSCATNKNQLLKGEPLQAE
jgi:hypothetical protein